MISQEDISRLANANMFSGGSAEGVRRWLAALPGYCEQYQPGQVVHFQGDRYDRLILLIAGTADARFQDLSGKVMRIETLTGPEAVAPAVLFSTEQLLPVTLYAETNLRLFRVDRSDFLSLIQKDKHILESTLLDMGDRLIFLAEKVRFIRFSSLRQKICSCLLQLRSRSRTPEVQFSYTREKLAEMFGVERPSLSRELSRMVSEGLISIQGKSVTIIDETFLRDCLEQ